MIVCSKLYTQATAYTYRAVRPLRFAWPAILLAHLEKGDCVTETCICCTQHTTHSQHLCPSLLLCAAAALAAAFAATLAAVFAAAVQFGLVESHQGEVTRARLEAGRRMHVHARPFAFNEQNIAAVRKLLAPGPLHLWSRVPKHAIEDDRREEADAADRAARRAAVLVPL